MQPINKTFDAQHRAMKAVYDTMEREQTWDSPEQKRAAFMVVSILWTLARCRVPPKAALDFLAEEMDKLGPAAGETDRGAGG
jgi:hypothetical protein